MAAIAMSPDEVQRFARASAKGCPEPVLTPEIVQEIPALPEPDLVEGLIDVGEAVSKGDLREQAPTERRAGRSDHVGPRPQALIARIERRGVLGHRDGGDLGAESRPDRREAVSIDDPDRLGQGRVLEWPKGRIGDDAEDPRPSRADHRRAGEQEGMSEGHRLAAADVGRRPGRRNGEVPKGQRGADRVAGREPRRRRSQGDGGARTAVDDHAGTGPGQGVA